MPRSDRRDCSHIALSFGLKLPHIVADVRTITYGKCKNSLAGWLDFLQGYSSGRCLVGMAYGSYLFISLCDNHNLAILAGDQELPHQKVLCSTDISAERTQGQNDTDRVYLLLRFPRRQSYKKRRLHPVIVYDHVLVIALWIPHLIWARHLDIVVPKQLADNKSHLHVRQTNQDISIYLKAKRVAIKSLTFVQCNLSGQEKTHCWHPDCQWRSPCPANVQA
jgi:hypothetical protein